MTDDALTQMLRRAAAVENPPTAAGGEPSSPPGNDAETESGVGLRMDALVMSRVRADEGRARRWRVFVQLMVGAALVAGVVTAVSIGWALAIKDDTHAHSESTLPPRMGLFREEGRP